MRGLCAPIALPVSRISRAASTIRRRNAATATSLCPSRSAERLGHSDVAVAAFRRLMVEAAREMRDTGKAIGAQSPRIPHATISSYEGVVPKTTNWRSLGGGSETPRERVA